MKSKIKYNVPDQTGKIAVITGANSGIGFDVSRELALNGAKVVLAVRSIEKGEEAARKIMDEGSKNIVTVMKLDLADLESVKHFAAEYTSRFTRLDILINNAGIMGIPFRQTVQGFEMHLGVNHLGHFALTALLIDIINRTPGGRIINVSSNQRLHKLDFDDLNSAESYSKFTAYGQSKVANLLFTLELDRRLKEGAKRTETVAVLPGRKVKDGANPVLFAATSYVVSGRFYGQDYPLEEIVSPEMVNYDDAERLWEISEKLTGIDFYIMRENEPDLSAVSNPGQQKDLI